jgi:Rrf2 family nitric oxide-sensitive transcriptional repressor
MKITRASDYAIRLLTHLATREEEGTSGELGKELDIPFNHLAKLVQILARKGYLITRKGKGGGLKLAADPKKIDLAEVIEAIEGPIVLSDCLFHRKSCRFSKNCKFRKCLSGVRSKIYQLFSNTTIFDLVTSM